MKTVNRYWLLLFFCISCWGCSSPETEKYQYNRDNVIQVKDKIKEIEIDSVILSSSCDLHIIDDYLLIVDYKSYDYFISIFDKNQFKYITSTAYRGEGAGEIINIGYIGKDYAHHKFDVSDYGKQAVFSYDLDSVLTTPSYIPSKKLNIYGDKFLEQYKYINDTICIGLIFEPISVSDFTLSVGTQNMNTGEFKQMPYMHPEFKKKSVFFDVSTEHGLYVESYIKQDLITICTINGELKYNIYGSRNWKDNQKGRFEYYHQVAFVGDKIFILYLNDSGYVQDPAKGIVGNLATKFLVLDLNGNYIATLETGYHIGYFCYDKANNRILLNMNDDILFGYLDLDGLVDVTR